MKDSRIEEGGGWGEGTRRRDRQEEMEDSHIEEWGGGGVEESI